MKNPMKFSRRSACGFSLLELTMAIGILGVIVGIAMTASSQLIRTNANVSNNVDLVQQGRQFMDQISTDLHMAGYPNYKMFEQNLATNPNLHTTDYSGTYSTTNTTTNSNAAGMIAATSTSLQFEGDIDNSGSVSVEYIQLCTGTNPTTCTAPTANAQCPCTMQRGTVSKSSGSTTPAFYTELTGVMNSDVFTFYDYTGWPTTSMINTRAVRIKLNLQSYRKDIASGSYSTVTLDTEAKLSN
jgi:prepilin-type N-terminal cleavage/methylation domain-containing protein